MLGILKKGIPASFILPGILALSLVLRFIVINQSLWLDEAIGALVVKSQSYLQILKEFPLHDNHPPLYYLALKFWTDIFEYSEVALRSLSVAFGVGTVFLVYRIGKLISPRLGILASLLLATSPFAIYYSQEARMYAMAAFLAAAAFYFFLQKKWIFFSISITALVFTDYMPVFLLPVFWIIGFLGKKDKGWWKSFALSHVPLLVLGLAWAPIFLAQSAAGRWLVQNLPDWQKIAGGATFKQVVLVWMKFTLGRISLANKTLYYFLAAVSSIPFIVILFKAWQERKRILGFWFWLLPPLLLGFLVSFFFPAFIYFRFLYVVPAFYLLLGWGVVNFKNSRIQYSLLAALLAVNFIGWGIYVSQPRQQREQWRQAVTFVEEKAKSNEAALFNFTEPFAPYQWYSKNTVKAVGGTDFLLANEEKTREMTRKALSDIKGVYYFEYLWELHDPGRIVEKEIKEEGFIKVSAFDFPGVGIIGYWKRL